MEEEYKIKSVLFRTIISMLLCLAAVIIKFVLKEEDIMDKVYNYLSNDIVFLNFL